jgi:hypothetical protein
MLRGLVLRGVRRLCEGAGDPVALVRARGGAIVQGLRGGLGGIVTGRPGAGILDAVAVEGAGG